MGKGSITGKDVARKAGVSPATVSRVINDDPRISDDTKRKVTRWIEKLNYTVNPIGRSLKTSETFTVGFLIPELANTFFMTVAKGIEDEMRKNGYSVILCSANEDPVQEEQRLRLLADKMVDGVIIVPSTNQGMHFSVLTEKGIPFVLVDRLVDDVQADAVLADNVDGSRKAIEYLIQKGFKRIGFIGGDRTLTSAKERYEGYCSALELHGIPPDESIIKFGDFHTESGFRLMKELAESEDPPDHVFIANYYMHAGAAKYLAQHGTASGKNIFLAGFDDMELTSLFAFSCIAVSQPMKDIGREAARMLLGRIQNIGEKGKPRIIRLPTELIYYR